MTKLKDFLHKRPSAWYMLYIPVYLLLFFIVEQLVHLRLLGELPAAG